MWASSLLLVVLFGWNPVSCRPVRVYNKGFNTRTLPSGGWTSWFNVDHPGGTGDYETVHSIVRHFGRGCDGIPCRKPVGIKAISVHGKSPAQEGDRVSISPRRGLTCTDSHQSDHRCADYKVRFYCPGMKHMCHGKNGTQPFQKRVQEPETQELQLKPEVISSNKFKHEKHQNKAENNILKNTTKARKNKTKKTDALGNETVTRKVESGAAFHKHLLWNDKQAERRRREQFVYNRWKNNRALHHSHSKWFSW